MYSEKDHYGQLEKTPSSLRRTGHDGIGRERRKKKGRGEGHMYSYLRGQREEPSRRCAYESDPYCHIWMMSSLVLCLCLSFSVFCFFFCLCLSLSLSLSLFLFLSLTSLLLLYRSRDRSPHSWQTPYGEKVTRMQSRRVRTKSEEKKEKKKRGKVW
jgi:hypothetical protein